MVTVQLYNPEGPAFIAPMARSSRPLLKAPP